MKKILLILISITIASIGFADEMPFEVKRLKNLRDQDVEKIDAVYFRELDKLKKKYAASGNYKAIAYIENMQVKSMSSTPVDTKVVQRSSPSESANAVILENLITNGDFSQGSKEWKGKENIEYETKDKKNKVCKIEPDKNETIWFSQPVRTHNFKELTVKFRMKKSSDYNGSDLMWLQFTREGGGGLGYRAAIPKSTEWVPVSKTFRDFKGANKIYISFKVPPGNSGYLMFDDISATGK